MARDFSRQNFLGRESEAIFARTPVGVVGLSGGGSHIIEQLSHIGVKRQLHADFDKVGNSNLNRLVGATAVDAKDEIPKTLVASRMVRGVNPDAQITSIHDKWQSHQEQLRECSVIFGCVDSFSERDQLDRFCRRFLIPYIDIGMDIVETSTGNDPSYKIVGQVALSMPGSPCLRCMGIITDRRLGLEAQHYGETGVRPQVVWPNGTLASTAIGLFVHLVTPWHRDEVALYYEYNGNTNTLKPSQRWEIVKASKCTHYLDSDVGDPFFETKRAVVA